MSESLQLSDFRLVMDTAAGVTPGQVAYRAWTKALDGRTIRNSGSTVAIGLSKAWEHLPERERRAWEAAALAVR